MVFANFKEAPNRQLQKTSAYQDLDPSEKGAVSYFFGLAMGKLFAARRFGVPWVMHLAVYKQSLVPLKFNSRLRPDLVGADFGPRWLVMEAKGRSGKAPTDLMPSAKDQTRSLDVVQGVAPSMRTGAITHFPGTAVEVALADPAGRSKRRFSLDIDQDDLLREYYRPIQQVVEGTRRVAPIQWRDRKLRIAELPALGLRIGLDEDVIACLVRNTNGHAAITSSLPTVAQPLARKAIVQDPKPSAAEGKMRIAGESEDDEQFFLGPDGVAVWLGSEWTGGAMAKEPQDRFK